MDYYFDSINFISVLILAVMMVASRGQPIMWEASILPVVTGRLETTMNTELDTCVIWMKYNLSREKKMGWKSRRESASCVF